MMKISYNTVIGAAFLMLACAGFLPGKGNSLHAQPHFQAEWSAAAGFEQKEFADNINDPLWGWGVEMSCLIPKTPLSIGASFVSLTYGKEESRVFFDDNYFRSVYDVKTDNKILQWHVLFRLRGKIGMLHPYLEGLAGINYLSTRTHLHNPRTNREVYSTVYKDDTAFSYGGGAGLMISLFPITGKVWNLSDLLIDLRGRYIAGEPARYLPKELILPALEVDLNEKYSGTDLITAQVGLVVEF